MTVTPAMNEHVDRFALASPRTITTTGPAFSTLDLVAGIAAALMMLGPLAMAAFAVGRY